MWLVLEFVDGFSLATLLGKRARFSPEFAATIGAEVARGARARARARRRAPRREASELLVSKRGDVKLVDFGIAQRSACRAPTSRSCDAEERGRRGLRNAGVHVARSRSSARRSTRGATSSRSASCSTSCSPARAPSTAETRSDQRAAAQRIRRDPARAAPRARARGPAPARANRDALPREAPRRPLRQRGGGGRSSSPSCARGRATAERDRPAHPRRHAAPTAPLALK